MAVSPDGAFLYQAAAPANAIQWLPLSGGNFAGGGGCIQDESMGGAGCATTMRGLVNATGGLALSPDSQAGYVYAVSGGRSGGAITVLSRNPTTGALSQLFGTAGCISADGTDDEATPATCATDSGLTDAESVIASSDGYNLYAVASPGASQSQTVLELAVNAGDGALTASAASPALSAGFGGDPGERPADARPQRRWHAAVRDRLRQPDLRSGVCRGLQPNAAGGLAGSNARRLRVERGGKRRQSRNSLPARRRPRYRVPDRHVVRTPARAGARRGRHLQPVHLRLGRLQFQSDRRTRSGYGLDPQQL